MLAFFQEKKYLLISLLIIILDGLIVYYIPSYYNNLNYLYPMLTISFIPFLYQEKKKDYLMFIFILGIIYDLLYSNIFLFNAFIFLIIGKIDYKIYKAFKLNITIYMLMILLNIIIYDSILFLLIYLTGYQTVTIFNYLYKIKNSMLLNIIFGIICYSFKRKH